MVEREEAKGRRKRANRGEGGGEGRRGITCISPLAPLGHGIGFGDSLEDAQFSRTSTT